jgi:hypothetical protein
MIKQKGSPLKINITAIMIITARNGTKHTDTCGMCRFEIAIIASLSRLIFSSKCDKPSLLRNHFRRFQRQSYPNGSIYQEQISKY